jgi:hypothetical protein
MLFLFNSIPKTSDIEYVEEIYFTLFSAYSVSHKVVFISEIQPEISVFESLKEYIRIMLFDLNINSNVIESNEDVEYIFDLPKTYFYEEIDGDLTIYITQFGKQNPEVTIVEILLFLIGVKLFKDGLVSVSDEIYNDLENSYRPFLVLAGVFFGFGELLMARHTITGEFFDDREHLFFKYSYKIPLDLNTLLYAQAFIMSVQKKQFNNKPSNIKIMTSEIKKELNKCLIHIERGNSVLFNKLF